MKSRQIRKFVAAGSHTKACRLGRFGYRSIEALDASALGVQGNDGFAVEQRPGEIAEAAAHFDHAPS